jgi:hypothetical protein
METDGLNKTPPAVRPADGEIQDDGSMKSEETNFIRVTNIANLFTDFTSIPADVLAAAAKRGKDVHRLCEAYLSGLIVSGYPAAYEGYLDSFKTWAKDNIVEIFEMETRRYCQTHMITGQIDLLVKLKDIDGLTLVDLKTSSAKHRSWDIQLGGYRYLLRETEPTNFVSNAMTLRLRKDGSKAIPNMVDSLAQAESIFFSALHCYKFLKLKPKTIEVE